jgi:hypothetical protein
VFGGTAWRWYSAEPCHPFLAVAQGKIANPLVLIDELEKPPRAQSTDASGIACSPFSSPKPTPAPQIPPCRQPSTCPRCPMSPPQTASLRCQVRSGIASGW